jgi:hypothetical protein
VHFILIKPVLSDHLSYGARQKIDEDLQLLDRQIRLQSGEEVRIEGETPAQSYLATPMVHIFNNLYK